MKQPPIWEIDVTTDKTAYERLQKAAAEASKGAGLLALQALRAVCREYMALHAELEGDDSPEADAARAVLQRIHAPLSKAVDLPRP